MKHAGDDLAAAKNCAYRLLRYRERSSSEIRRRLREKGFTEETCKKVESHLMKLGYIDDNRFAGIFARSIIRSKPSSLRLVKSKLYSKGIHESIIEPLLADIKENYDELEVASSLVKVRMKRLGGVTKDKAKQRLYNFLVRRQFTEDIIREALAGIFDNQN